MNPKELYPYKICDPIHGFIRFNEIERKLINSPPFQRLRYIHQMGCAYLIYPGATHKRFEHSIGTMELVTRIYDNIVHPRNLLPSLFEGSLPESEKELYYWRQILRLAALCHDLGHLPFSHTAEADLLPLGGHEKWTIKLIQSQGLQHIWSEVEPLPSRSVEKDIMSLSISERELKEEGIVLQTTPWQRVLSQVITEDNFGADRIDYLIRDSRYTGVGYGHFDYQQLIDTLRVLPSLSEKGALTLGVSESGLQSIEALWIARYLMYARVYLHSKSRIYSKHLSRFMKAYFDDHGFPLRVEGYLKMTDYFILHAIDETLENPGRPGYFDAGCLMQREACFQEVHLEEPEERYTRELFSTLDQEFRGSYFTDLVPSKQRIHNKERLRQFPVLTDRGAVISSLDASVFLRDIPLGGKPLRVYVDPKVKGAFIKKLASIT